MPDPGSSVSEHFGNARRVVASVQPVAVARTRGTGSLQRIGRRSCCSSRSQSPTSTESVPSAANAQGLSHLRLHFPVREMPQAPPA